MSEHHVVITCPWCAAPCIKWEQSLRTFDEWADGPGLIWRKWLCGTNGYEGDACDRSTLCEDREQQHMGGDDAPPP